MLGRLIYIRNALHHAVRRLLLLLWPQHRVWEKSAVGEYQYWGEFRGKYYDGFGILVKNDGSFYIGKFSAGFYHGQGTSIDERGNEYQGDFRYNAYHGSGALTAPDGTRYAGTFRFDSMNGWGAIEDADGEKFSGRIKDFYPYGLGINRNKKGEVYVGWMRYWRMHGFGKFKFLPQEANEAGKEKEKQENRNDVPEWGYYIGKFKEGAFHGKGTFYWPNKIKMFGGYHMGVPHGRAMLFVPDGRRVRVRIFQGSPVGRCEVIDEQGNVQKKDAVKVFEELFEKR